MMFASGFHVAAPGSRTSFLNTAGWCLASLVWLTMSPATLWAELLAGVAVSDITRPNVKVHDPSYAKVLVLRNQQTTAVLITVDAVAIGEIGYIGNEFLPQVREAVQRELAIPAAQVLINASHCHASVRADVAEVVIQTVKTAAATLVPVRVRSGVGTEPRISENRRMWLKDGTQIDMRRAYSMPSDADVDRVGPIDPQVGVLRLDRLDGRPLAIVYHFACHPIMNPPAVGSSADFPGVASQVIEQATGATAFFVQGCAGDINPVHYKEISRPANAAPLGSMLGATVLAAAHALPANDDVTLRSESKLLQLPRADDYAERLGRLREEKTRLLAALRPTNINFKTFLPLLIEHRLWPETPAHYAAAYLHDASQLHVLDADNRAAVEAYLGNIAIMEQLTRLQTNERLLEKHYRQTLAAADAMLTVEVNGLRIGPFKWITFPGELTVEIGLNIKRLAFDPHAHISGYTNGYIYYTATEAQRTNAGYAQEDCDVLVAPAWQKIFEVTALEMLQRISAP